MIERGIKCVCGSRHATVVEVRECRGITPTDVQPGSVSVVTSDPERPPSPLHRPVAQVAPDRGTDHSSMPEDDGVDPLKCPYCTNAWGRMKDGTTLAVCEDCLTYWDTAAPPPKVTRETVYSTQNADTVFHATRSCEWLEKGQQRAEDNGWERTAVNSLSLQRARALGKVPCRSCAPRRWWS